MLRDLKISFTINPYRKYKKSNFEPKLSEYWKRQYYDMFKNWQRSENNAR